MPLPKLAEQPAQITETNVRSIAVARHARGAKPDPYNQAVRSALRNNERNILTGQVALREFATTADIVLWDLDQLLKPALDKLQDHLAGLDALDKGALLTTIRAKDQKAVLLLQCLDEIEQSDLDALGAVVC